MTTYVLETDWGTAAGVLVGQLGTAMGIAFGIWCGAELVLMMVAWLKKGADV